MSEIELEKAPGPIRACVHRLRKEPVLLTRRGRLLGVLVSIQHVDINSWALHLNPRLKAGIERYRARLKAKGEISVEETRKVFGLPRRRAGDHPRLRKESNA